MKFDDFIENISNEIFYHYEKVKEEMDILPNGDTKVAYKALLYDYEYLLKTIVKRLHTYKAQLEKPFAKEETIKRKSLPIGYRVQVFKRDNFTCQMCNATKQGGAILEVDHIIPISRGGTDDLDNLQTLCSKCNGSKNYLITDME